MIGTDICNDNYELASLSSRGKLLHSQVITIGMYIHAHVHNYWQDQCVHAHPQKMLEDLQNLIF